MNACLSCLEPKPSSPPALRPLGNLSSQASSFFPKVIDLVAMRENLFKASSPNVGTVLFPSDAKVDTCMTRSLHKARIHPTLIQRLSKLMVKESLDEQLMESLDYATISNALKTAGVSSWGTRRQIFQCFNSSMLKGHSYFYFCFSSNVQNNVPWVPSLFQHFQWSRLNNFLLITFSGEHTLL